MIYKPNEVYNINKDFLKKNMKQVICSFDKRKLDLPLSHVNRFFFLFSPLVEYCQSEKNFRILKRTENCSRESAPKYKLIKQDFEQGGCFGVRVA